MEPGNVQNQDIDVPRPHMSPKWKVVPIQHRDSSVFLEQEKSEAKEQNDTSVKSNKIDDKSSNDNNEKTMNDWATHAPVRIIAKNTQNRDSPIDLQRGSRLE